jgi:hypothetical protein
VEDLVERAPEVAHTFALGALMDVCPLCGIDFSELFCAYFCFKEYCPNA